MSTINWILSGTLDTSTREGKDVLQWLADPDRPPTPEELRDAFIEAAHSGEFEPLRASDIDGFTVQEIDDKHVHSMVDELKLDTFTLPRRCITCGQKDPNGVLQ